MKRNIISTMLLIALLGIQMGSAFTIHGVPSNDFEAQQAYHAGRNGEAYYGDSRYYSYGVQDAQSVRDAESEERDHFLPTIGIIPTLAMIILVFVYKNKKTS